MRAGNRDREAVTDRQKELLADLLLQAEQTLIYPASLAQRRLWFLDQLQQKSSAYNIHLGFWLCGALDLKALYASLQEIVNRHEILRTAFRLEGSKLQQVVARNLVLQMPVEEVHETTDTYSDTYHVAQTEVETPFDLSQMPLFRVRVLRYGPEDHVLLCTMHHIISDAWSVQILARELATVYEAFSHGRPSPLKDLPITYGEYSEWQHASQATEPVQGQLSYWRGRLRNAPAVLRFPTEARRPSEQTFQGASQSVELPPELVSAVKALAPGWMATPFMLLLAAFKVLLYRHSGQPDLLIGVPIAGRNREEVEGVVGFFVNTLVFRDNLSGNPRFSELVEQVRETALGAFANADAPFEQVVESLQPERNLSYNPVFQVMFAVVKAAVQSHNFGGLTAYPYVVSSRTSIFDLSCSIIEGVDGKWFAQFDFNTDLFAPEFITRMLEDYVGLLQSVCAAPDTPIIAFPLKYAKPSEALAGAMVPAAARARKRSEGQREQRTKRAVYRVIPTTPEQETLLNVWKSVLASPDIGIHDNFFEVGGHSLLATRLIGEIQQVTGRRLPVSAIFRAPTIASLARVLREYCDANPDPLVMKLNDAQHGLPFFGVAIPAVDTTGFAQLARHFSPHRPFYKLQASSPVLWKRRFCRDDYRDLARQYVEGLRSVQAHGPYCVGAMCLSVVVAQEMVLQLEAEGEEVAVFVIFDTWVMENSQYRSLYQVDYYFQRLRELRGLPRDEKIAALRRTVGRWFTPPTGPEVTPAATGDGWKAAFWPGKEFRPPQFKASVLLFKRPRQPYYRVRDSQMGWGLRSLGGVEVCVVDCGHVEMLREPVVGTVSEILLKRIDQVALSQETKPVLEQLPPPRNFPNATNILRSA